jgi:methylglyoxal synthase
MAKAGKNKKLVRKSAICIFAGRDSQEKNIELGRLLAFILSMADRNPKSEFKALLDNYFFVITDGTFNRIFVNSDFPPTRRGYFWDFWHEFCPRNTLGNRTLNSFFKENCICMRGYTMGGIILFANMVVTQHCSIVWPFLDPHEAHCTRPENLALLRLCDVWKAKWLPNFKSVIEWVLDESKTDAKRSDKIEIEDDTHLLISLPAREVKGSQSLEGTIGSLRINEKTFKFRDFSKGVSPRLVKKEGKDVRAEITEMKVSLNLTFLII